MKAKVISTDEGDDYIDWRSEVISRVEISTTNHNALTGKQGGIINEYYHLTSVEYTNKYTQGNEITIKVYEQDTEPDIGEHKLAIWIDTSTGGGTYLIFRRGTGDQVSVELA